MRKLRVHFVRALDIGARVSRRDPGFCSCSLTRQVPLLSASIPVRRTLFEC
jgi:hypothetical protein